MGSAVDGYQLFMGFSCQIAFWEHPEILRLHGKAHHREQGRSTSFKGGSNKFKAEPTIRVMPIALMEWDGDHASKVIPFAPFCALAKRNGCFWVATEQFDGVNNSVIGPLK